MYTRLISTWDKFRSSFWFVPALMMFGAALMAYVLLKVDFTLGGGFVEAFPRFEMSPPAARSILSSIVGAMVTSTGVVFSITIVALSLASSHFGSRLIRTFQNRKSTHFTLGIFVSTSLYCILVLASIREVNDFSFVPTVSVVVGIILAIICLATLIFYIHDMSCAIQAPNVINSSSQDLLIAIERMFPSRIGDPPDGDESRDEESLKSTEEQLDEPVLTVECNNAGYVQAIQNESIEELANENGWIIRLLIRPGDFICEGVRLAEVFVEGQGPDSVGESKRDDWADRLRACVMVGANRTPTQDVRYAFDELVEIAVRALSPGINDPFTAINCVDRIHAALRELRRREVPSRYRCGDDGQLRVIAEPVAFEECLEGSLAMIDHYASDAPLVHERVQSVLQDVTD